MASIAETTIDVHATVTMSDQALRVRALELAAAGRQDGWTDADVTEAAEAYRKFLAGEA